jgi:hypothetical protein
MYLPTRSPGQHRRGYLRSPRMARGRVVAYGLHVVGVYAGRDWHTDQGQHTSDFILCTDQNLETGTLNRLARQ